jgi:hypothetical protein
MVQVLLVGIGVGVTLVGLVSLAVRVLRWTRKNRPVVSGGIADTAIGSWLGDFIDNLNHSGSDSQHSHSGHDGSHADNHHSDSSPDGGGIDSGQP